MEEERRYYEPKGREDEDKRECRLEELKLPQSH